MSIRLKAPRDCGAVSHRGQAIEINSGGMIEVEDEAADALLAHGFTPFDDELEDSQHRSIRPQASAEAQEAADPTGLKRRDLIGLLKNQGIDIPAHAPTHELKKLVRDIDRDRSQDDGV